MDNTKFVKIDIIIFSIIVLFFVSLALSLFAGLDIYRAVVWNILTSLDISLELPVKFFETPYLIFATAINMVVFAGLTVVLATVFFNFLKNIDLKRSYMLLRINKLKGHTIVVPYNNDSKVLLQELDEAKQKYVIIGDTPKEMRELYKQKRMFVAGLLNSDEVFNVAGIKKAKYLVAYSYKDLENILTIITAKTINPDIKIISRVNDEDNIPQISRTNVNKIIIPDIAAGEKIGEEIINKIYRIIAD
ncbi:MAG: NAD-binding protein [Candidatus Marsarchaeota archaeon]|nr:NAD-binding protein [Candidatus Marsarchaeota archaeon]MCL5106039.1 NAD-binding protein [Candidatus Marsarchaeota archaeon]